MEKNALDWVAFVLVIVGSVNWGLFGLFDLDLVQVVFGSVSWLATLVYALVGLAGLYMIYFVASK